MSEKSYGIGEKTTISDATDRHAEEVALQGYSIIPGLLDDEEQQQWRNKIDVVYEIQESEFGKNNLGKINELDMCRAPLLYDRKFIDLASHPIVMQLMRKILGEWFILNLQNGIINRPENSHHQASWHRDLPYQNWVTSKPLAINALFALDPFSVETGGTLVLPYSHKMEVFPSQEYVDNNKVTVTMPAGSVVIFDSMLFHRAGENNSSVTRRAVNHMYSIPILKQQYDFPSALGMMTDMPPFIRQLLGHTSQVPLDDKQWRQNRVSRNS